jgi:hypothetical protein
MPPFGTGQRQAAPSLYIGGIGVFRTSAWDNRQAMEPDGLYGFTAWQDQNKLRTAWISPPLDVFLLDRLPREPWMSYGKKYIENKWQRPWGMYDETYAHLWQWWCK